MKKILVIEDDRILKEALRTKLEHVGFEVFLASNGEEGIMSIDSDTPDVVLLDLEMPRMGGLDMLKKLNENKNSVNNIIVMTNDDTTEPLSIALELGIKSYIVKKDWTIDSIVERVNEKLI